MEIPNFLYHYTSIDTLKLILKNKCIRLNRLDNMDDADECVQQNGMWGIYYFVSCWTDEDRESIEMWKMYSDNMKGVRIKLKTYPFLHDKDGSYLNNIDINMGYRYMPSLLEDLLLKIKYDTIENVDKFKQKKIYSIDENGFCFYPERLAMIKNDYWAFQKEWRYRIITLPNNPLIFINADLMQHSRCFGLQPPPFNEIFLKLEPKSLKQMEILLGPKVDDAEKVKLQKFISRRFPRIKVSDSILKDRIK